MGVWQCESGVVIGGARQGCGNVLLVEGAKIQICFICVLFCTHTHTRAHT